MRFPLRPRGAGLPAWASDDEPVGDLYRGGYVVNQIQIVPWGQLVFMALLVVGLVASGAWTQLVATSIVFGPLVGPMLYFGFYARRWQWSSIEVRGDDVLVRNPTGVHLFRLDTLTISKTGIGGLFPFRLRIADLQGRTVLCFGLGDRGWWPMLDGLRPEDFKRAVELRQRQG